MALTINEAAACLMAMDQILLLTHRRPDGDTVGSAGALCLALRSLGKTAFLAENPDLTPKYGKYVRHFTAPDDFRPQAVVTVDIATASLLPDNVRTLIPSLSLVLDHHPGNDLPCGQSCILPEAGACGELIWKLLVAMQVPLNREIAQLLYVAVSTDTGCFAYANTTSDSHEAAAACLRTGIDIGLLNRSLFGIKSRARLAVESLLVQTMRFEAEGQIAIAVIPLHELIKTGATEDDLDSIASFPRSIEGVDIGITIKETVDGCKISVRTGQSNAAAICAVLGGGGHLRAAGAYYHGTPENAVELLLAAARKELSRG